MEKIAKVLDEDDPETTRLPEGYSLLTDRVLLFEDPATGKVTLSVREDARGTREPFSWEDFFRELDTLTQEERDAYVIPRDKTPPRVRDLWK